VKCALAVLLCCSQAAAGESPRLVVTAMGIEYRGLPALSADGRTLALPEPGVGAARCARGGEVVEAVRLWALVKPGLGGTRIVLKGVCAEGDGPAEVAAEWKRAGARVARLEAAFEAGGYRTLPSAALTSAQGEPQAKVAGVWVWTQMHNGSRWLLASVAWSGYERRPVVIMTTLDATMRGGLVCALPQQGLVFMQLVRARPGSGATTRWIMVHPRREESEPQDPVPARDRELRR
jgi:hypothetical protein